MTVEGSSDEARKGPLVTCSQEQQQDDSSLTLNDGKEIMALNPRDDVSTGSLSDHPFHSKMASGNFKQCPQVLVVR